ncbi:MAG TPA: YkvA family protein [Candidatus Acidoferrales bacterium]|nr:YkvA family protein [Candidatus Acidoferrales bacterium]
MHRILFDLAHQVAPADLETMMDNELAMIERARNLTDANLALFQKQLSLAIACVRDHVDGECPQIPYYTISLIGAALLYFTDEFDAIPDFLPEIGHLDDAVVMAMAFELGADGLRRYCDFKEIDATGLLPPRRS